MRHNIILAVMTNFLVMTKRSLSGVPDKPPLPISLLAVSKAMIGRGHPLPDPCEIITLPVCNYVVQV